MLSVGDPGHNRRPRTFRTMNHLPVESALPRLRSALVAGLNAVLRAPPGSGKTTRIPLALLNEPWLLGRRIVVLEPRRLAARAAAGYMALLLQQPVGRAVGYRVRGDTRVGSDTRVEVVTEGVLTRMLQSDPALENVGLLVFDEFHERSIHADLGLALALHSRSLVRPDLRILVMSATLDTAAVAELLDRALVFTAEGRSHPVETRYRPIREGTRLEDGVGGAVLTALAEEDGDVLVFLPGAPEIRRVASRLHDAGLDRAISIMPLYGDLSPEDQAAAIRPSPPGTRKVVLATSIAQTSLTIEGVRVVVDAGLSRIPRFSPRTGMARLATVPVSRASAEQRRGRAGRTEPGVCYRLWDERLELSRKAQETPEILDADLAPLALELAAAGIHDPAELRWLDPPPAAALGLARELLRELAAVDGAHRVTPHGRRMAELAVHPRLAHMLLRAAELGLAGVAADLAAVLSERDPLRGVPGADADIRGRLDVLRRGDARVAPAIRHRLRGESRRLLDAAGGGPNPDPADAEAAGVLLSLAYPDRIAQRRSGGAPRYLLRNGQGAYFADGEAIGGTPYIVAAELDGEARESRIFLAAPVSLDDVLEHYADQITFHEHVGWDEDAAGVVGREEERLGALILRESRIEPTSDEVAAAVLEWIGRAGIDVLTWSEGPVRLRQRLGFLHQLDSTWPDVSDAALIGRLAEWLGPSLAEVRRRSDLKRVDVGQALLRLLDRRRWRDLDALAPTHVEVPSGSRIAIDYTDPSTPVLPVRLQEVFGWQDTPKIVGGRVPLTLHLLSPAGRPVQVTRDLAGFWRGTYFDVRKDLKGRYPKHDWPDDPLTAMPSRRVRRRG